ncbi:MAG: hypothetical protein R3C11_03635 [Planctomycetaceae bacterium]
MTASNGDRDRNFLERVFQKLLINFTWWVNRKDIRGKHVFSGFLGLDNIGIFDRSKPCQRVVTWNRRMERRGWLLLFQHVVDCL